MFRCLVSLPSELEAATSLKRQIAPVIPSIHQHKFDGHRLLEYVLAPGMVGIINLFAGSAVIIAVFFKRYSCSTNNDTAPTGLMNRLRQLCPPVG